MPFVAHSPLHDQTIMDGLKDEEEEVFFDEGEIRDDRRVDFVHLTY